MPEKIHYKRLTYSGYRRGFAVAFQPRGSLWLGPDHLLCVDSNRFVENYKRFYFRDIQAIIIRKTKRRLVWNTILAVPLLACLVGLLAAMTSGARDNGTVIVCLVPLGFVLLFLLINNIMGAGCICYLRTAVQIEELPSVCRLPKARRVLKKLRPHITAAQGGELSAEDAAGRMQEWVASLAAAAPAAATVETTNAPPRLDS